MLKGYCCKSISIGLKVNVVNQLKMPLYICNKTTTCSPFTSWLHQFRLQGDNPASLCQTVGSIRREPWCHQPQDKSPPKVASITNYAKFKGQRNWIFFNKLWFSNTYIFSPDGVNLWYFKLRFLYLTKFIVLNIKGL